MAKTKPKEFRSAKAMSERAYKQLNINAIARLLLPGMSIFYPDLWTQNVAPQVARIGKELGFTYEVKRSVLAVDGDFAKGVSIRRVK